GLVGRRGGVERGLQHRGDVLESATEDHLAGERHGLRARRVILVRKPQLQPTLLDAHHPDATGVTASPGKGSRSRSLSTTHRPLLGLSVRHPSYGRLGTRAWGECPNAIDRKSTRLNSSHVKISYAVFCL